MKKNMGGLDRGLRIALTVLVVIFYLTGLISGTLAVILSVLAVIFLVTSYFSFCPLYAALGLSTRREEKK